MSLVEVETNKDKQTKDCVKVLEVAIQEFKKHGAFNVSVVASLNNGDIYSHSSYGDRLLMLGALEYAKNSEACYRSEIERNQE